ncbi:MAG TPA: cob(I)yrinic acid a,c-diamide adenosyltransferase [Puia sp.]|nr:cob(I)yrinic acid a,c-diamide adenosyltransferase [Puia sp.]
MASKIYTRTGDKGKTSLIGGTKVPKSHLRIESYGTVDELNSFIGLLYDQLAAQTTAAPLNTVASLLREIQDRLFTIGSSLACDPDKAPQLKIPDLKEEDIVLLEKEIDRMNEELPPMKSFLLPGGNLAVSTAHIARCVCRRAERICVNMQENKLYIEPIVLRYLNRLSDYLFMLSRYVGHRLNIAELPWKPRV